MPPQRKIFADPYKILLNVYCHRLSELAPLLEKLTQAEAEKARVESDRDKLYQAAKSREDSGEKIDWPQFFTDHPLRYSYSVHTMYETRQQIKEIECGWMPYSCELFAGRDDLSASWKQAYRAAARKLTSEGMLERRGTEIRISEAGKHYVESRVETI